MDIKFHKIIFSIFIIIFFTNSFSQKKLFLKDSFEFNNYNLKKVSSQNIKTFCNQNKKTVIIHYSNWCSAFSNVDSIYRYFKGYDVYMLLSHKKVSIKKQVNFLKEKNIKCNVLYPDFKLYKHFNYSMVFEKFLNDICNECSSFGYNSTNHVVIINEQCQISFPHYSKVLEET